MRYVVPVGGRRGLAVVAVLTLALSAAVVALITDEARAATPIPTGGSVLMGDVNRDGWDDVLAIKGTDSTMWFYQNNRSSDPASRLSVGRQIMAGWSSWNRVMLGDYSGDGYADLIATKPDGTLWYWRNIWTTNTNAPFTSAVQINAGWGMFSQVALGDINGDGWTDLLGIKPDGTLWFYRNNHSADPALRINPGVRIGTSGWAAFIRVMVGDFSGTGYADFLGMKADGTLWMAGNRWVTNPSLPLTSAFHVNSGWQMFNKLALGDFSGDGWADVFGWEPDGNLSYYRNNHAADPSVRLDARVHQSAGWRSYTVPPRIDGHKITLFLHGYGLGISGFNCGTEWFETLDDYRYDPNPVSGYSFGELVTVGWYDADVGCTIKLPIDGVNYYGTPSQEGTHNESIKELGRELGWEIYSRFSRYGVAVDIVGHSMGGLVARAMLTGNQLNLSGWAPYVFVEDVVTLSTPHGGTRLAWLCGNTTQCNEMEPSSDTLDWMLDNPQGSGNGTDWTLIGSQDDDVVAADSATNMGIGATPGEPGHKIIYPLGQPDGNGVEHYNIHRWTSGTFTIRYCDYWSTCDMDNQVTWITGTGPYDPVKMGRYGVYYWSFS